MVGLYAGESSVQVILVTGVLGGGAAWLSGSAIASAWRPAWHVGIVAVLLGGAARFFHFALFQGMLLSAPSFACDTSIFFIAGMIAWRARRAAQMVRQYPWLYAPAGPLNWREIRQENEAQR